MTALEYFQKSIELIEQYPDSNDFIGPQHDEIMDWAEKKLNIKFPESYKMFISNYGRGGFDAEEYYGLRDNRKNDNGIPDVVWVNLDQRKDGYVIDSVLMICFDGMGDYYSIDTTRVNEEGENPIILWTPGLSKDPKDCEVVAESFGEFFYNRIKQSVDSIESEE